MQLTINDFEGYNNDCEDIQKIKSWIDTKGGFFTAEELLEAFSKRHYEFEKSVLRHLKPHLTKQFVTDVLKWDIKEFFFELQEKLKRLDASYKKFEGVENIDELLSYKAKIEFEYQSKHKTLDREIEKYKDFKNFNELLELNQNLKNGWGYKQGTVIQVLNYFFEQSFQTQSYLTTNNVMQSVLYDLCKVAKFDEDDFIELRKKFNFDYWGHNQIECFYACSISYNNNSAWKSIEKSLDRNPFILKNRRMYEGVRIRVAEDNKWVDYRCTGWNDAKKIKFVIDNENSQKRLSFDNKEFKSYFKDKKIQF